MFVCRRRGVAGVGAGQYLYYVALTGYTEEIGTITVMASHSPAGCGRSFAIPV